MLLALDIGNTNIVAGVFDGTVLAAQWRLSTQRERTSDELAAFLKIALNARDIHFADIRGVAISSVVPPLTPQAVRLARDYFGCEPLVVGPNTKTGLKNMYDDPAQLGPDRLANALAAWKKFDDNTIIVDCGTATKVDAVTRAGHFLGGAIAPGLELCAEALFAKTARLPRVELKPPARACGRNTVEAMQSGLVFGYAGLVKELIGHVATEFAALPDEDSAPRSEPATAGKFTPQGRSAAASILTSLRPLPVFTVVATGGLAELIAPLVPILVIEPHLTLDGLRLMWELSQ